LERRPLSEEAADAVLDDGGVIKALGESELAARLPSVLRESARCC